MVTFNYRQYKSRAQLQLDAIGGGSRTLRAAVSLPRWRNYGSQDVVREKRLQQIITLLVNLLRQYPILKPEAFGKPIKLFWAFWMSLSGKCDFLVSNDL